MPRTVRCDRSPSGHWTDGQGDRSPSDRAARERVAAAAPAMYAKDGAQIIFGDRVFNYYDQEWGTVGAPSGWPEDGWFEFLPDAGGHVRLLNGERVVVNPHGWAVGRGSTLRP